jgi:hypothetical protein
MNRIIYIILTIFSLHQLSFAQDISLNGTIWIDSDQNNLYNGEAGINDVKIYLINANSNEILDSTLTISADFNFPSSDSITIPPGSYYLQIAQEEFTIDGNLQGIYSCNGFNDANNGVDFDDNGLDGILIQTTHFTLDSGLVEHIDFCLIVPCDLENVFANESCSDITELDIICDLNTLGSFCASMPTVESSGNQPNPLCSNGGTPGNISWFAFVAYAGNYSINVLPSACDGSSNGLEGIQVGIYTDCTFTNAVFCHPDCSINPISIDSDLLNAGQTYYFFIDGCGGSVCSYAINIEGSPVPPNFNVDQLCIIDEGTTICEDSEFPTDKDLLFTFDNLELELDYTWAILALSGGPFEGNSSPITKESNIELSFNNVGVYSVCLTTISSLCISWSGSECRTVTIKNTVGLQTLESTEFKITPNPTIDFITIDGDLDISDATFVI